MTKGLTNQVFALLMERVIDVNTASRGISHEAAKTILNHSQALGFETDVEWPLIIRLKSNLNISYREVEGLEHETHIKYPEAAQTAGGLQNWMRQLEQDPKEWLKRVNISQRMIETAIQTQRKLARGSDSQRIEFKQNIDRTVAEQHLTRLKRRQKTMPKQKRKEKPLHPPHTAGRGGRPSQGQY